MDSLQSRAAPVFEVPASIDGVFHRLGLDTLAGVSCVGSADLSPKQLSRAVPTAERLHHAGGEPLSTALEVTLDVSLGPFVLPVTFNVVETGRFKLGFLLGMDVLERYHFRLDVSNRTVLFDQNVFPIDKILEARSSATNNWPRP